MSAKKRLKKITQIISTTSFMFLLVMPASTNYKLKDYGFGSGGTGSSSDANGHSLEAISGEQSGQKASAGGIAIGPGLTFTNQANVPVAPTFTNPSNYYNRLQLVINTSGNPTDTKYVVAISTDSFTTTNYVQSADGTIGATQDYQTYATWGGASGIAVVGLQAGTTYQVKAKAMQGNFTETGYGPTASAATVNPTLAFNISTNTVNFGDMIPNTVNNSLQNVTATLSTNAANGGNVYMYAANGGLHSAGASYTISSVSNNLSVIGEGYGAQGVSGGTMSVAAPYDQIGTSTVGIVDPTIRDIFYTSGPVSGGTGIFMLKAKPATTAPSAGDYTETLTVVASGSF